MPGTPTAGRTFRDSVALLGTRRFGTFWVATLLSSMGTWAQQVAEPWLLLSLGASPFVVGLDAFAMDAPVWGLTLLGGVLADRADRRWVILLFQSIQMLCPMLVVALLLGAAVQPWMIVGLSLVVGVTDALSMPSFQSIVPSIVAYEQIGTGIALNSTQLNLSRILGPAVAGILMVRVGALGCFVVSALSYVPFILVALWILPRRDPSPGLARPIESRPPFAGSRKIVRTPALRGPLLTVFATSTLCSPLVTFCPVLVKDVFHADASHFGGALAAFGLGGLAGATGLLAVEGRVDGRRLCARSAVGYGVIVVAAAVNQWLLPLMALLGLAGAAMTVSNASANTLLQRLAGPRLRGQTASLYMLAIRGGRALGALLTGGAVHVFGVRWALVVDGTLAVLVQLALARSPVADRLAREDAGQAS